MNEWKPQEVMLMFTISWAFTRCLEPHFCYSLNLPMNHADKYFYTGFVAEESKAQRG